MKIREAVESHSDWTLSEALPVKQVILSRNAQ